ncbi:MAG: DUF3800 domain-containing protein [Rhabdochlamydiaceae bacterium]|nr:DUF3800 domain-containing protein [Rhabdochlamydiaceae bacterium]
MSIAPSTNYSDYIVYVDESGDHSLTSIDEQYPVFVLSFCVFEKTYYAHRVTAALRMLKFTTFGHDMVILHEQDIRKKIGSFHLMNKERREVFFENLNALIAQAEFTLFTTVIDKYKIKKEHSKDTHVYHLAMELGLEKLYHFLQSRDQDSRLTHVICEARGRVEDRALAFEFHEICSGQNSLKKPLPFELIISDKKTNSEGLQFADLAARPVGLSVVRPSQLNRAFQILQKKFYRNSEGKESGHGFYVYPLKSEKPQGSP